MIPGEMENKLRHFLTGDTWGNGKGEMHSTKSFIKIKTKLLRKKHPMALLQYNLKKTQ